MLIASNKFITCLKIGCPTKFITVFLLMLCLFSQKQTYNIGVKLSGSNPVFFLGGQQIYCL